ncbi:succinate dehydrogenase cytochrome b subunit [Lapillicoccus sp.]|uniref:succinate dehydrogenase cytochrome b subunit n=1 Tax=Lapillicoccus sp. TaxID=1909287 RepID=UPI00387E4679
MFVATSTLPTVTARRTTIAMKMVMAVSGALFVLYVLAHMYGNLKAFGGKGAYDDYSEHLRTLGEPILPYSGFLWVLRLLLVGALVLHVYSAFYLWSRSHSARSTQYQVRKAVAATISARFMRWGGVALLLFIIVHLLQFTTNTIRVDGNFSSPYDRLVAAFHVWWVVVIYLLALAALGMHLRHGVWSASQTLGWTSSARARRTANTTAITVALVVSVGFAIVPLSILVGLIT